MQCRILFSGKELEIYDLSTAIEIYDISTAICIIHCV